MARDSADLANYNYLSNTCSNALSLSAPPANRDRIVMEMVLLKGQPVGSTIIPLYWQERLTLYLQWTSGGRALVLVRLKRSNVILAVVVYDQPI